MLAVSAVACGGHASSPPRTARPAKLPRTVAQLLSRESDAVAAALARGDTCEAKRLGQRLRVDATASISRIPVRFQESLSSGVNTLLAELPACHVAPSPVTTTQATPPPAKHHDEHEHHKEKPPKHHKHSKSKHGKKKDDD